MKRISILMVIAMAAALSLLGCEEKTESTQIMATKVDGYKPNLPPVPKIPEPSAPETYGDGSYSVYGLRKNVGQTMNTAVDVTAYVVEIYQKPECAEGETCYTMMPHLFLADEQGEPLKKRQLRLVGYAQNFASIEDAKADADNGKAAERNAELEAMGAPPPAVWDWKVGQKYKIKGAFVHRSSAGFMDKDGILEYKNHECLDCPEEDEEK